MAAAAAISCAVVSGACLTLQGGAASAMARSSGRGVAATYLTLTSSTLALVLFLGLTSGGVVDLAAGRAEAPWYAYLGGLLGSFYV
ncbi:hypothetical protein HK405_002692, partial [Cladochytrium tenue]